MGAHAEKCDYPWENTTSCNCDGYHTFGELYEHRAELFLTLCRFVRRAVPDARIWRSYQHHDGSGFEGMFIIGINMEPGKQITYHLPLRYWDDAWFATVLDNAPKWDEHTSDDVLARLRGLREASLGSLGLLGGYTWLRS